MTKRIEYESMTPGEAWETFVGSQSVHEFMFYSPGQTPEQAAGEYMAQLDPKVVTGDALAFGHELSADDRETIAAKLAQHIKANIR